MLPKYYYTDEPTIVKSDLRFNATYIPIQCPSIQPENLFRGNIGKTGNTGPRNQLNINVNIRR